MNWLFSPPFSSMSSNSYELFSSWFDSFSHAEANVMGRKWCATSVEALGVSEVPWTRWAPCYNKGPGSLHSKGPVRFHTPESWSATCLCEIGDDIYSFRGISRDAWRLVHSFCLSPIDWLQPNCGARLLSLGKGWGSTTSCLYPTLIQAYLAIYTHIYTCRSIYIYILYICYAVTHSLYRAIINQPFHRFVGVLLYGCSSLSALSSRKITLMFWSS